MHVIEGDPTSFDLMAFGQAPARIVDFVRRDIARAGESLSALGQIGMRIVENVFDRFHGAEAVRRSRELSARIGWLYKEDCVRPLLDLRSIQTAQPVMQRWVMAHKGVRKLHLGQQCAGYGETYVDIDPGKIGHDHYDYRRVMDGIVQVEDEDKPLFVTYLDDLIEGDRELTIDERADIFNTWDHLDLILRRRKEDPTSRRGDTLE